MTDVQNQHSGPPEVLTIYYGIHDALRELGDPEHDAGDGENLGTEHTISGLWDASSALSRLVEQLEAAQKVIDAARAEYDNSQLVNDEAIALGDALNTYDALSNPASIPPVTESPERADN